jgi:hypothetical protein
LRGGGPIAAILAGALFEPATRAGLWTAALVWMGIACLWNERRCGRTHCRYTGPFYLAMIVPVLALGFGLLPFGAPGWITVGLLILFGGKLIWWATERAWGRYA